MTEVTNNSRRILFIDRDGVLLKEVPPTYQVDSWDKLEFYPQVFKYMGKIAEEFDYLLVMVSNQDGLGTPSFPAESFWPIHNHVIRTFENEGVKFHAVHIDTSFPEERSPNRKPGIGMLKDYLNTPAYDIAHSFVIGDRITDVALAKNLGCKAIWLNNHPGLGGNEIDGQLEELKKTVVLETHSWQAIYAFLKAENEKYFRAKQPGATG
ncbi:MAG: histidinol-phosphatase [Chitinophagaceae bacterium]